MTNATPSPLAYGIAPASFRLPHDTRLGRVRLQIADLDRSVAYYETVIGLRVIQRSSDTATLGAQGDDAVIVELRAKLGVHPVAKRGHIGLYHFAILLPDRAALGRFVAHLAAIGEYAGMSDHLVSEAVYLRDPDGLGIEVYCDRPRESWEHRDRQLLMASDPLDVPDLVAAAGGVAWAGAPAGTKIGHVHLHVRDLDEAARFYHDGIGFDKTVWNYPGALFLSAGGYHHHLGTNTWATGAPLSTDDDARLLDWEILLPNAASVAAVADSLEAQGAHVDRDENEISSRDPWGTQVRIGFRG